MLFFGVSRVFPNVPSAVAVCFKETPPRPCDHHETHCLLLNKSKPQSSCIHGYRRNHGGSSCKMQEHLCRRHSVRTLLSISMFPPLRNLCHLSASSRERVVHRRQCCATRGAEIGALRVHQANRRRQKSGFTPLR